MKKKSFVSRSRSLFGIAASVATKEVGLKVKGAFKDAAKHEVAQKLTRIQQAKVITKNLAQLKGAAMKAGQLLSIDASQYLPPEAREVLSQLQSLAEPERFEDIQKVLNEELGDKLKTLEDLQQQPLAAASIGQVHKAKYQGKDVVLKVQYPGVNKSIDSDLEILRKITKIFLLPTGKKMDLQETFDELALVLKLETDYIHEAQVLKKVNEELQGQTQFFAPAPFTEMSTKRVLCMEYCEGAQLSQWIKSGPSKAHRQELGALMLDIFLTEFLDWGFVQTDPNFGNFLIREKPLQVVLLDFGSTLEYSNDFISEYLQVIKVAAAGNPHETFKRSMEFGLIKAKEPPEVIETFSNMMAMSMEPFVSHNQPFDFSSVDYENRSREAINSFTRSLKYSPPPKKILFLHRKLGGLFNLLKMMDVQLDLRPYWQKMMDYQP